jgi:hypothetical protein
LELGDITNGGVIVVVAVRRRLQLGLVVGFWLGLVGFLCFGLSLGLVGFLCFGQAGLEVLLLLLELRHLDFECCHPALCRVGSQSCRLQQPLELQRLLCLVCHTATHLILGVG